LTCADTDGSYTCDAVYTELGEQLGTLEIDPVAGTVTVVAQPANFTLSDAVLTDEGTFDLTVENGMDRLVFNLKTVVDSVSSGSVTGTGNLWFDDHKPYLSFGGTSVLPGDTTTGTLTVYEVGSDVVTVELHLIDAPSLILGYSGYEAIDTSMAVDTSFLEAGDGEVSSRQRVVSPNGRFVYTGSKNTNEIEVHDTSTGESTTVEILATDEGGGDSSTAGMAVSSDGETLYVLFSDGVHYNGYQAQEELAAVSLVELDTVTFEETRRLDLHTWGGDGLESGDDGYGDPEMRTARYLTWSPDGTVLAASVGSGNNNYDVSLNELWFIDAESMTVIDTDDSTADVADPVILPAAGFGEQMVWEGDYVVVGHNKKNAPDDDGAASLSFVHSSTYEVTTVEPPAGHGPKAGAMSSSGGVLYYAGRDAPDHVFSAIDVATQTEIYSVTVDLVDPEDSRVIKYTKLEEKSGNLFVGAYEVWVFDAATGEAVDADGNPDNGISSIEHGQSGAHSITMTPF